MRNDLCPKTILSGCLFAIAILLPAFAPRPAHAQKSEPITTSTPIPATRGAAREAELPPHTHILSPEDVARLAQPSPSRKNWADRLSVRGYAQLRYSFPKTALASENDRSVGPNTSLFIRRARVIISGEASDLLSIYIQPDFATAQGGAQFIPQIRDFYADIFTDLQKHYRLRAGVSKVPYGFENPQSSQNRLAFDRNDALNTAVKDERDLGLFFYWETGEARERFRMLIDKGLKGSGDYGVFALGMYNGQGLARPEANSNMHVITRLTYPFQLESGQFFEPGISAYSGQYDVAKSSGAGAPAGGGSVADQRKAFHAVWYPQPWGLQAEYNFGRGPQLTGAAITAQPLHGGYIQTMYKIDRLFGDHTLIPFARWQYYKGGRKAETNAPANDIRELEAGVEWQATKAIEVTASYVNSHRTNADASLARTQLQWNF